MNKIIFVAGLAMAMTTHTTVFNTNSFTDKSGRITSYKNEGVGLDGFNIPSSVCYSGEA